MTHAYQPEGPFFIAVIFEDSAPQTTRAVRTAYVDGFDDEDAAWRACDAIRADRTAAIDEDGEDVSVDPQDILQVLIARNGAPEFLRAPAA